MAVESDVASWLKAEGLYAKASPAGAETWGDDGLPAVRMSAIATAEAAQAIAVLVAAFLVGILAKDRHIVPGLHSGVIGKPVRLINPKLGYADGAVGFVISAAEAEDGRTTTLTVLKRL